MKRIFILLASLLVVGTPVSASACAYGSFGSSEQFKSSDKTQYRLLCDYQLCSLSIADDGAWGAGSGFNETVAANCSLESCRANSDYPETCQVVDLNQESDFIKKRTQTTSSTTTSERFWLRLGRTSKDYEECYSAFHNPEPGLFGSSVIRDWADAIKHSNEGNNTKPEVMSLKSLCAPFLSEDALTWTAPLPDELMNQGVSQTPLFLVDVDRDIETLNECFTLFQGNNIQFGRRSFRDWRAIVDNYMLSETDSSGTAVLFSDCGPFLSNDYLTWTAPLPEELKEQSVEENQVATIPEATATLVWCATAGYVLKVPESGCKYRHGKSFSTKAQAQAEHQRLKNQSSTVATTTEVVESQPTEIGKSALELEFWQSIKESNDPDMYREYLRQFPSGVYAGLAKLKIKKLGGDTTAVNTSIPNLDHVSCCP